MVTKGVSMKAIAALLAAVALPLAAAASAAPARGPRLASATARSFVVTLGVHRFGHLSAPEAVAAKAGPHDVGFPAPGEGCCGPDSFEIGRDRSVWLLDGGRQRLVVWKAGKPATIAGTIPLPKDCCEDFALDPRGGIFATQTGTPTHRLNFLYRLRVTGSVVWRGTLAAEGFPVPLRIGPDGALYSIFNRAWQPATTPAGRPLSVAAQRRGARRSQPLAGGRRLTTEFRSAHEVRFGLVSRTGTLLRSWRVLSKTALEPVLEATPELVGGDPVVFLTVWTPTPYRAEYLVLRLAPTASGTRARLALGHRPPLAGWSDIVTDLRVGPDGRVYQLGSSPSTGIEIRRYSLR
jgi:hypothetical protein